MPSPYLPLNFNVTSSVSVQNVADQAGVVSTYVWLRQTTVDQKGMQFRFGSTENPDVVLKLTSTAIIPVLTAALSSALENTGVAGSWP
jgi:hypothetical protein